MADPASPEGGPADGPRGPLSLLRRPFRYVATGIGVAGISLLLFQLLLGRRLAEAQVRQLGIELAAQLTLAEVGLERFPPAALGELSGLRLAVGSRPESVEGGGPAARWRRARADQLRDEICRRLAPCPTVLPAAEDRRGVWISLASPLEQVWLFAPLPPVRGWPPDPLLLSLCLGLGTLTAMLLYLSLEVQRPLRQLEQAIGRVNLEARPAAVPAQGARAVRQLTGHFNAMLERLETSSRERRTMLAGIAHDLRRPLTRLGLRLGLADGRPMGPTDLAAAAADLQALERITNQFLLFAGAREREAAVEVPLDGLLAEVAAVADASTLQLEAPPLLRRVRPGALARAIGNLLDNALCHGRPPVRLVLRGIGAEGFEIQIWDEGEGIPADRWQQALQPFQRLDDARGGEGHCGLGLAIAGRVAREHGGTLVRLEEKEAGSGAWHRGVGLRGSSLPPGTGGGTG